MEHIVIPVGSVTTASRLKKLLSKNGLYAEVIHTPRALNGGSCSYSVKTHRRNIATVKKFSQEYKLNIKGIYQEEVREGEKKYYDLS